ncbi:MAG: 16S rRNA (cytosine(967)-C(5))-methyltransferase RsmB [Bacteroidetes bacterium]|nr:16S rRNA (cytosine(967)-C(5))-methyltransferase RsmB [Bacteroidota bacterium]
MNDTNMNIPDQTIEKEKPDFYSGVRGLAVKILNRVDRTDAYLDKLLEVEIRQSELISQDKALLFEIVHGVIRWLGRIDWILTGFYKGQFTKSIPNLKNALRVALYQILFLDKVPEYAAVNEAVDFVKRLQGKKSADLTNAVLRNIIRSKNQIRYPDRKEDLIGYFSAYYSHPSWLVKRWINRYGEKFTEEFLIANNNKPSLTLRVNSIKTSKDELKKLLNDVDLKFTEAKYLPEFIRLNNLTNIVDWEYFQKGYFSIQDESTGFPCKILDIGPEMKVLDLCAAPGGKTGFLAELMENKGELIAVDRYESRLKMLNKNLERLGVKNVKAVAVNAEDFNDGDFDRVLIDAPCSGLGTLTKKPDIKWKKDFADLKKLADVQYGLLVKGASLVKPGGVVVYSTCTIEPEENFEIVQKFLNNNPDYELSSAKGFVPDDVLDLNGCVQSFPHTNLTDGAFSARIVRKQ